jgi:hypothetical protein
LYDYAKLLEHSHSTYTPLVGPTPENQMHTKSFSSNCLHHQCMTPEGIRYAQLESDAVGTSPNLSLQLSVTVRTTNVTTMVCGWGSSSVILVYKLRKSYPEVIYYLGILCFNHRKGGGEYEKDSDLRNESACVAYHVIWTRCKASLEL